MVSGCTAGTPTRIEVAPEDSAPSVPSPFQVAPRRRLAYPVVGANWVTMEDVNNDGKLDLVVPTTNNTVAILLGNGDGTFKSSASYGVGASPAWVALGDINRDGVLDLAVAPFRLVTTPAAVRRRWR